MSNLRSLPERLYEPNIIHNPLTWMGIWTPQGWRIHRKRWGRAVRSTVLLSGDGQATFFPEALFDPFVGHVAWSDDLHLADDPLTDGGIYPCDPRVEHPIGRPRWSISHTLLCYPFADHTLYTHEYVWDLDHGHLHTHFRRHVELEQARTDPHSGRTVTVTNVPLSTTIEGNRRYSLSNSAVRGVWDNPGKSGRNYYTHRICCLIQMANGVYATVPRNPVVQCHGLYATAPDDNLERLFERDTSLCGDPEQLQQRLKVPLDAPRLGMLRCPLREVPSNVYEGPISMPAAHYGTISEPHLAQLAERLGARFQHGNVGFGAANHFDGRRGAVGYVPAFDFNNNGEIDREDAEFLRQHLGREVRYNLYLDGYFGGDWLSTSCCLEQEHRPGTPLITDYEYGGGYDAEQGVIHLLESPGPDRPVWVEYHYDAPAEPGENNIRVHIYRELQ
jgi:hypothetical protein